MGRKQFFREEICEFMQIYDCKFGLEFEEEENYEERGSEICVQPLRALLMQKFEANEWLVGELIAFCGEFAFQTTSTRVRAQDHGGWNYNVWNYKYGSLTSMDESELSEWVDVFESDFREIAEDTQPRPVLHFEQGRPPSHDSCEPSRRRCLWLFYFRGEIILIKIRPEQAIWCRCQIARKRVPFWQWQSVLMSCNGYEMNEKLMGYCIRCFFNPGDVVSVPMKLETAEWCIVEHYLSKIKDVVRDTKYRYDDHHRYWPSQEECRLLEAQYGVSEERLDFCFVRLRHIQQLNILKRKYESHVKKRTCAACGIEKTHKKEMKKCGSCKWPSYCSRECQRSHWTAEHKSECFSI